MPPVGQAILATGRRRQKHYVVIGAGLRTLRLYTLGKSGTLFAVISPRHWRGRDDNYRFHVVATSRRSTLLRRYDDTLGITAGLTTDIMVLSRLERRQYAMIMPPLQAPLSGVGYFVIFHDITSLFTATRIRHVGPRYVTKATCRYYWLLHYCLGVHMAYGPRLVVDVALAVNTTSGNFTSIALMPLIIMVLQACHVTRSLERA